MQYKTIITLYCKIQYMAWEMYFTMRLSSCLFIYFCWWCWWFLCFQSLLNKIKKIMLPFNAMPLKIKINGLFEWSAKVLTHTLNILNTVCCDIWQWSVKSVTNLKVKIFKRRLWNEFIRLRSVVFVVFIFDSLNHIEIIRFTYINLVLMRISVQKYDLRKHSCCFVLGTIAPKCLISESSFKLMVCFGTKKLKCNC